MKKSYLSKAVALSLIAAVITSAFAGCKDSTESTQSTSSAAASTSSTTSQAAPSESSSTVTSGEKIMVKYVIPGTIPGTEAGFATAMDAINAKLEADGTGLGYELETIAWDIWDQKVTLKLTSGEPFDLFHVMEDQKGFGAYLANDSLVDITDAMNKYGQNILAKISPALMEAATVDGSIYAIPAYWCEPSKGTYALTIRKDLFEKNNLELPNTREELLNAAETIQKNWSEDGTPYIRVLYTEPSRPLHRTFETYPFTVVEQLLLIDQQGNVSSWIESEEFKQEAAFYAEAYDRGLIHPDTLTLPSDHYTKEEEFGRILFREGTGLQSLTNAEKYGYEQDIIWLNKDAEFFSDMAFRNDNVVPITSKNPEAAVKFLDWVYSNQDNYDVFMYGVEGVTYTKEGDRMYEIIKDENEKNLYNFSDWMVGNLNLARSRPTQHPSYISSHMVQDSSIVPTVISGFQFDSTTVSAEYANCVAEVKTSLYPIRVGIVKYDDGIAAAVQNLKAAGIEKVVAEYQRQLTEWMGSK